MGVIAFFVFAFSLHPLMKSLQNSTKLGTAGRVGEGRWQEGWVEGRSGKENGGGKEEHTWHTCDNVGCHITKTNAVRLIRTTSIYF